MVKAELWKLSKNPSNYFIVLSPFIIFFFIMLSDYEQSNLSIIYILGTFYFIFFTNSSISRDFISGVYENIRNSPIQYKEYIFGKFSATAIYSLILFFETEIFIFITYYKQTEATNNNILYMIIDFISKYSVCLLFISMTILLSILIRNRFSIVFVIASFLLGSGLNVVPFEFVKFFPFYMMDFSTLLFDGSVNKSLIFLLGIKNIVYIIVFLFIGNILLKQNIGFGSE
ncbi:hypothetical protein [Lysinibacillus sp. FSL K6-0102]|uniref:hypothetical protein n=1 Tax=Lysinibacillus sp. FSL K6-0102 TaxID=2975290 RepID=UPI0030F64A20